MTARQVMEWKCDRCRDVAVTESSNRPEGWAITEVDGEEVIRLVHLCSSCVNGFDLFLEGADADEIFHAGQDRPPRDGLGHLFGPDGKVHGSLHRIFEDEGGPEQDPKDALYLDLKGAREKLCRAQTGLASRAMSGLLDTAVACIDRVGEQTVPDVWSKYDHAYEITPLSQILETLRPLKASARLDVLQHAMKNVLGRVEEQADAVIRRHVLDPDLPPPAMR